SGYRNKMNESKPHMAWARSTMDRAQLFGVSRPEVSFVDILSASLLS
ncbi:HpcH/HpaI aldolase/citrate lyase family protein, partial [Micrococcus sp.]